MTQRLFEGGRDDTMQEIEKRDDPMQASVQEQGYIVSRRRE